jgi:hypothetical protein
MSTLYSPKIVTDGMVLHLDAANKKSYSGSGTTWTDRSGNGNHGTLQNGTGFSSDNGGHLTFDDSNDRVLISNSDSLNPTDELTIEAWVNFDGNSQDFIFEKGVVNTQWSLFSHGYDIMFRTFHEPDSGYTNTSVTKSTYITNGQWHHIVGSWDGANKRIYIDSNLVKTAAKSGALKTSTATAAVGSFGTSTSYPFGGKIAKVGIYNRGLTSDEVSQNYNATKSRFGL